MATRISTAERIARYLAKHPGATVQEARGHGRTAEHGFSRETLGGGELLYGFRLDSKAEAALRAAERESGDGARVSIAIKDKNGSFTEIFKGKGYSLSGIKGHVDANGWRDGLRAAVAGTRYAAVIDALLEGAAEFQLEVE